MLDQLTQAPATHASGSPMRGGDRLLSRPRHRARAGASRHSLSRGRGEPTLALPHGSLEFTWCTGAGIARAALEAHAVTVRSRAGGERLRPAAGGPVPHVETPAAGGENARLATRIAAARLLR
jgi:hypothetical protein